ncbi:MAG: SMC-Scp complex subunit ScpB [Armatimonadota bacterium]
MRLCSLEVTRLEAELSKAVEAILFVAEAPLSADELTKILGVKPAEVEFALEELGERLSQGSGLQLVRIAGGYQLCTRPEMAEAVSLYLKPQRRRLTRSALEVLAIVAYRQPVTTQQIEEVRGVQSDYALRTLAERGLIEEVGRKQAPGRPILWGTTQEFLHQFHLNDISELPPLDEGEEPTLEEVGA